MRIRFNDFVERYDDNNTWACLCNSCKRKYNISEQYLDDSGIGTCSVEGCENEADFYIDFPENNISINNGVLEFKED